MSHFALVINGIVENVIVADQDFIDQLTANSDLPEEWIQTSYNTYQGVHYDSQTREPSADQSKALRKNFAAIGYSYDRERDAFIPPKEFNSWVFDENKCDWVPPLEKPNNGQLYTWNEETRSWDLVT
jgi:hypothetical protein